MEFTIPTDWLEEAEVLDFCPKARVYKLDPVFPNAFEIPVQEILPVRRAPGVPLLKRDRTVKWLRRMREGIPIAAIQVRPGGPPYQVYNGTHRLYTSIAMGYSHIWAVLHEL